VISAKSNLAEPYGNACGSPLQGILKLNAPQLGVLRGVDVQAVFFSFLILRFSFKDNLAAFLVSRLPLSFLPFSPISTSPSPFSGPKK
jgi:hypothetical protein